MGPIQSSGIQGDDREATGPDSGGPGEKLVGADIVESYPGEQLIVEMDVKEAFAFLQEENFRIVVQ